MNVEQAYSQWAQQYDTNENKTRDLEAVALKECLHHVQTNQCLEIGCGTGKNTLWLATIASNLTAVDLTEEMLARAKEKVTAPHVQFIQADITHQWSFATGQYDLVTFSLVLEHIQDLSYIFSQLQRFVAPGGSVYIGELHPFKQYQGSKARFTTEDGLQVVTCFTHHLSGFVAAAKNNGFHIKDFREYFDDGDQTTIPRIAAWVFTKGE